jgi:hypothetical protein
VKKNSQTTTTKTTPKIAPSTSTTMTIAAIVATTSCAKTRASPASSNGKVSANKSSNCGSAGNYYCVVLPKKREWAMCLTSPQEIRHFCIQTRTHKKETFQMPLHLPHSLNWTFDNIFHDDVSMDSFVMSFGGEQDEPSLSIHYWKFVMQIILIQEIILQPVLTRKKMYSTKFGNTK